jgi:hypothetical protein
MPQVILQPSGNQGSRDHYRDTVSTPVPLERVGKYVDEATLSRLRTEFPTGAAAIWGVTPGGRDVNAGKWEKIQAGDVAVFLKDGRADSFGTVVLKFRNRSLAEDLWGRDRDGDTWEYVYFLRDVAPLDLSYDELNGLLGYKTGNNFMGFNVLPEHQSEAAVARMTGVPSKMAPRVWWVNQGQFYREQRNGEFIWAPKTDRGGATRETYTNVSRMRPGDVVLHYANGIRAVGRVKADPYDAPRPPEFGTDQWNEDGFRADVAYRELAAPIGLAAIPEGWRTDEARRATDGPFQSDGGVKLAFLFPLRHEFLSRMQGRFPELVEDGVIEVESALSDLPAQAVRDFEDAGLLFSEADIARFVSALITKPFVILTGLAGSGKTKLAQGLAYWIGSTPDEGRSCVVAVGSDWTSKDSVLGYANALNTDIYERTEALKLFVRARDDPGHPYFLILDEMNLSHVERYFADILSSMESGEPLRLHSGEVPIDQIPPQLALPGNVYVVGTVNVDETTYMFSPKVLDRANVIEFQASANRIRDLLQKPRRPDLGRLSGRGAAYANFADRRGEIGSLSPELAQQLQEDLLLLFDVLAEEGLEFAYRVTFEVAEFLRIHRAVARGWRFEVGMDAQILQKLLPRLHGSQRKIEGTLAALAYLCLERRDWKRGATPMLANASQLAGAAKDITRQPATEIKRLMAADPSSAQYPLSFAKLRRMLRHLERNGFTSFAEA